MSTAWVWRPEFTVDCTGTRRSTNSKVEIDVQKGGVAVLTGSVADAMARAKAVQLAQDTVGVTQVIDQLVVLTTSTGAVPAAIARFPPNLDRSGGWPCGRKGNRLGLEQQRAANPSEDGGPVRQIDQAGPALDRSANDRIDDLGEFAAGLGQPIKIVLARCVSARSTDRGGAGPDGG